MIGIDIRKPLSAHGGATVLQVRLRIESGSFTALAGPSGSGKTTLLRILAGLEEAEGTIRVDGETWLEEGKALRPQKRAIGFVFQDYALFPNMTVRQNLLFVRKDPALAAQLLELTEMESLAHRYPHTLSGGQQQRVALCRAMMNRPKLLLLDEPLSALDPAMRARLQHEILTLHRRFGTTTIMVSHDPGEIYRLAERVLMLERGKITADGEPKTVLLHTRGSQKFSFEGELLDIVRIDVMHIAVVAIGQQIVEVALSRSEAANLRIGEKVRVGTKAFAPTVTQA